MGWCDCVNMYQKDAYLKGIGTIVQNMISILGSKTEHNLGEEGDTYDHLGAL